MFWTNNFREISFTWGGSIQQTSDAEYIIMGCIDNEVYLIQLAD